MFLKYSTTEGETAIDYYPRAFYPTGLSVMIRYKSQRLYRFDPHAHVLPYYHLEKSSGLCGCNAKTTIPNRQVRLSSGIHFNGGRRTSHKTLHLSFIYHDSGVSTSEETRSIYHLPSGRSRRGCGWPRFTTRSCISD